jgi:uncharacterized protein
MVSYNIEPQFPNKVGDIVAGDPSDKQKDKILLGTLAESGKRRQLWLDISGEQVIGILGKRGTGKSYTLGVLIEGLSAGNGDTKLATHSTPRGGLVFDIMDIYWSSVIQLSDAGSPEIIKQHRAMVSGGMEPQELGIEVWVPAGHEEPEIDPPNLRSLRIDPSALGIDDWGALFDLNIYTEPRGMLVADVIRHVSESGYAASGVRVEPVPNFDLAGLVDCLENADFVQSYDSSTIRAVKQRLQSYARLEIFQGSPTPLNELIQAGNVSVLMLSRVPDELKQVIVSVLMSQILRERGEASFAQKRLDLQSDMSDADRIKLEDALSRRIPRTWVLMDEAHVLAGTGEGSVARDAMIKYAKEGRSRGLSLAVATQQPGALDNRLMSQVETLIVHQLTASKDASIASENMKSPTPESIRVDSTEADVSGLLLRLGQGQAIFSCGNAPNLQRSCVLAVRPRITAHGGYEA